MVLEHNEYKNSLRNDQIDEEMKIQGKSDTQRQAVRFKETHAKPGRFKETKKSVNLHCFCINQLQPKFLQFHLKTHSHILRKKQHTCNKWHYNSINKDIITRS